LAKEREGGIGGYPVPLSMTMAGRAVASMAGSSGESPPAHASAAVAGRRGIGGVRRDRGLSPPGRLIGGWALAGGGLGSGRSIRDRMARGLERDSGRRGGAWRGDGEETSRVELVWLTREAGRKEPARPAPGEVEVEEVGGLSGGLSGSVRVCEVGWGGGALTLTPIPGPPGSNGLLAMCPFFSD